MEDETSEIVCTVVLEVNSHKKTFKNTKVNLCRNEFNDLIIKLSISNTKYVVTDWNRIHRKFVDEGKASIELPTLKTILFISNCPPHKLKTFIDTLKAKISDDKPKISARKRLLTTKTNILTDISPISIPKTPKRKRKNVENVENIDLNTNLIQTKKFKSNFTHFNAFLTADQKRVIDKVRSGRNVFFTGSAGTGKSFLLKKLIGILPPENTVICASTGVAACHVGGVTLHSFTGTGSNQSKKNVISQWQKCQHLIIDEISMVDGDFFAKLDKIAKKARKNEKAFGGIQLILSGDFFQLPPVSNGKKKSLFCFQVTEWDKCEFACVELTTIHRQKDQKFIDILQNIRLGRCSQDVADTLRATEFQEIENGEISASRLCTHKKDVERINEEQLANLFGHSKHFTSIDNNPFYTEYMDKHCPVNKKIILKIGCQVMLCKNLNIQKGLVNGARGVVTGFQPGKEGLPIVKFKCGIEQIIQFERFVIKSAVGTNLTRQQIPLILAWAVSIHKSQGMTLDCVELCLKNVFAPGQAYVAMSRAKCLEGMRIVDFDPSCVRADEDVLRFYERIKTFLE